MYTWLRSFASKYPEGRYSTGFNAGLAGDFKGEDKSEAKAANSDMRSSARYPVPSTECQYAAVVGYSRNTPAGSGGLG
jgi:hypothetical protein